MGDEKKWRRGGGRKMQGHRREGKITHIKVRLEEEREKRRDRKGERKGKRREKEEEKGETTMNG